VEKRRRLIIAVLLVLTLVNYTRLTGSENIRTVAFISIFAIGALSALLINEFVNLFKAKR
jgi:hypothetical protein